MSEHTHEHTQWCCEDCGWLWPVGTPPASAECDNCGGELAETDDPKAMTTKRERENGS